MNKKRKSIQQQQAIATNAEYSDFFEEYVKLIDFRSRYESALLELREKDNELHEKDSRITVLVDSAKLYYGTGAKTIIRSIYEVVLKRFENNIWMSARSLYRYVYQIDVEDSAILMWNAHELQLAKASHNIFDESINEILAIQNIYLDGVSDSGDVQWRKRAYQLEQLRFYYSEKVEVQTLMENCNTVIEGDVRKSLETIYKKLCDEVHQAGSYFSDDSVVLPRASDNLNLADIYAFATIVKDAGFKPRYPQQQEVKSSLLGIFPFAEVK